MKNRLIWIIVFFQILTTQAQIEISLRKTFIDSLSNMATISTVFIVDDVKDKVNPASKDGDIHMAGRDHVIALPLVAEIMNAKTEKDVVKFMQGKEHMGSQDLDRSVHMTGAWRIWCEHGGKSEQIQGKPQNRITSTNPDHVFEIHPVTQIDNTDLTQTLFRTRGYKFKDAEDAFRRYDITRCTLKENANGTVTITTNGVGYNYVEFVLQFRTKLEKIEGGYYAQGNVYSLDDEFIASNIRMIFIEGSASCDDALKLGQGSKMRVIGIPRISMGLIKWRLAQKTNRPEVLNWNLPYEMIIVGQKK